MGRLDTPTALVLGGLATWRVTHLLAYEDGPGEVVVRLRKAVDQTPVAGVMDCFKCTSIWVGAAMAPIVMTGRIRPRDGALVALGLSAAACLLDQAQSKG